MSCMARELCGGGGEDEARASTAISSSSLEFGYSDHFPGSPIRPSHIIAGSAAMGSSYNLGSDTFNFTSGINLIGFTKNGPHSHTWTTHHHQQNGLTVPPSLKVGGDGVGDWDDGEDRSLRCSIFPCERNERPSQGLSLSLSSANPSQIGLQSFQLRHAIGQNHNPQGTQFDDQQGGSFFGKSIHTRLAAIEQFDPRNSKHLIPAQELLNEFCSLMSSDTTTMRCQSSVIPKQKAQNCNKTSEDDENRNGSSSLSWSKQQQSLQPFELKELQKRKTKLLAMLHEVDRQYRHYRNQMKAVVSSFEAVAGDGAAIVYLALASKAMSRHFRCLRDGIVGQIRSTKAAIGEKDTAAPGMTKGETPRLRIIDQALRQQRAFQQMSTSENHPWRPQRGLPERSVSVLRAWLFDHFLHPYPSDVDKHILSRQTGLSRSQVSNWFINARVRLWKPMVEEMYMEETKEHDNLLLDGAVSPTDIDENSRPDTRGGDHILLPCAEDQKPSSNQLMVRIDSDCLSSVISGPDPKAKIGSRNPNPAHPHPHPHLMQHHSHQWTTELDFSSYNPNVPISYDGVGTNFGGVSLTLGLQQHGGRHHHGMNLGFSSAAATAAAQGSLFYPREQIQECHPGLQHTSILDGEGQNLPYRDLMGVQLLHDLA